jgi:GNAT superfamily N-acetyltransferase
MPEDFRVRLATGSDDVAAVRALWREYWTSFGLSDDFQNFGEELAGLPGAYAADGGVLLIAWSEHGPAGTIALRRLNAGAGEIKRLYLRPRFRGKGLGRTLLESVVTAAREIGYQELYADTLPSMKDALALYSRMGFETVSAYSEEPTPCGVFFRLSLT